MSRWIICEKISRGKKTFEIDKVRGCLLKNLGQLSESFRQFRQNFILTVESKFYGELFIVRTMLFGMICRILGEKMSSFLRNCSCTNVRTAFYVNKRKAFLSILMRKLCFPKCLYFFKIVGFEATFSQFFSIEFFGRVVKAVFRCTEDHFMEKTNLKQPFRLEPFFRILNKKYSDFSQKVFARFRKNRSTCPEEQSMKNYETKK